MFDPQTVELIRSVRATPGIDPARLPELLTQAFTELVSHRMAIAQGGADLLGRLKALRQIANVYEVHALLATTEESRRSAAFVSGTAHLLLAQAARAELAPATPAGYVGREGISPDLSAALLLSSAGYLADAAEAVRGVEAGTRTLEGSLVSAIAWLVRGELNRILELPSSNGPVEELVPDATRRLWNMLLEAIRLLAARLSRLPSSDRPELGAANALLREVLELSIMSLPSLTPGGASVVSTYAGPHHLAALLYLAGGSLGSGAVVDIPAPPEVDPATWNSHLIGFAERRPYLWPNHAEAVQEGYLRPGTSAVLSFPTGAGKSTLAELKIAAILCTRRKVVFLAPTLALVAQCVRSLKGAFPNLEVRDSVIGEGYFALTDEPQLPDIAVMTPERCLFLMGLHPAAFESVGLVIFDECHLLHPHSMAGDRRAIDAMLCLLGVIDRSPNADVVLLSAMIENSEELAGWIGSITQRPCLSLNLEWKPTRQARGCVVFAQQSVSDLRTRLATARLTATTKGPPTTLVRRLTCRPFGYFGLHQTWHSNQAIDYVLVPLLSDDVALGASTSWQLTANKNDVAARMAKRLAEIGVKTIVFTQDRRQCESICANLNGSSATPVLLPEEQHLIDESAREMGGQEHVVLPEGSVAVCHHSLLLPTERALSEKVFRRANGAGVIVATPTLAQGMNLPAGAVVLAGESRFDPAAAGATRLEAHELLNAAGRAGRAGFASLGIVLVVPSDIVAVSARNGTLHLDQNWFALREEVFGKVDQCLTVDDPLTHVLDRLHLAGAGADGRTVRYFLNRLPLEAPGGATRTLQLLGRSLGAYRAARTGTAASFSAKAAEAARLRAQTTLNDPGLVWCDRLASLSGVAPIILQSIDAFIGPVTPAWSVPELIERTLAWLTSNAATTEHFVAALEIKEVFPSAVDDRDRVLINPLRALLCSATQLWTTGATMRQIELALGTPQARLVKCVRARKFARRLVVEIAYVAGLFPQVIRERSQNPTAQALSIGLAVGAACLRNGFNSPELLALHMAMGESLSRVGVHQAMREIGTVDIQAATTFDAIRHAVDASLTQWIELREQAPG